MGPPASTDCSQINGSLKSSNPNHLLDERLPMAICPINGNSTINAEIMNICTQRRESSQRRR